MALNALQLFTAQAVDGSSPWYKIQGGAGQEWHAFLGVVRFNAGTGNVKLECSLDGVALAAPLAPALTATGTFQVQLPPGLYVRFTLAGSAGANIDAWPVE